VAKSCNMTNVSIKLSRKSSLHFMVISIDLSFVNQCLQITVTVTFPSNIF
jgi:hypothetical protein